ncbi:MAG: hypothetical protein IPF56_07570 [Chloroflexi bacterium]|nr:hypothetical protein [Chloroflexota bacterium]MBK7175740.1 hypothetical protein [Chloroflexota bacterium]MBP7593260.1 hypothetical protein [Chloroflexota bacterium]
MFDKFANDDFQRALRRGFLRKLVARITGQENELLPYSEVRSQLPFQGQHDLGQQTIPIDKIVGSVGRYRDFDRAYLPTQTATAQRWIGISKARYKDIDLPPIEAYKIGEVYFVKDGNHRVSVARERQQVFIDAYVTEIDIPVTLTADMGLSDVLELKDYAHFLQQTGLRSLQPDADLQLSNAELYGRLHEHINAHRWYISQERGYEVPYPEAVASWYNTVYQPLADVLQNQGLPQAFPNLTLTDLYLLISEYQWLRRAADEKAGSVEDADQALRQIYNQKEVRRVLNTVKQRSWIDRLILAQERAAFYGRTHIQEIRPDAAIEASLPGKYEKLLHHIDVHRYYMGQNRQADVSYEEAVASWYDTIYLPAIQLIREQDSLKRFPNRTETDIYIWALDHGAELTEALAQGEPEAEI